MQGRERKILKFPDGFLWGASTSAHQVEGGNINDWSNWEESNAERLAKEAKNKWQLWQQSKFPEMFKEENYISHKACDHYNLYEQDFDLAKKLNFNAFRLSIEWSRIEAEEGKFNKKEIEHYKQVIKALEKRGMEPFITLWHFTNPIWFAQIGGWKSSQAPYYFNRYVEKVVHEFKRNVKFWITLNEPGNFISQGYLTGNWPPQEKSWFSAYRVWRNLLEAHHLAYKTIKKLDNSSQVGIADGISYYEAKGNNLVSKLTKNVVQKFSQGYFLERIKNYQDFIGLNYYHRGLVDNFSISVANRKPMSDLGWELYPQGIYFVLDKLKGYKKPIYITEVGLADERDEKRAWYIEEVLRNVYKAIEEGADVRGHFYWSLIDNFEWDSGFWPRFGLAHVNYKNLKRKVRQSALEYAKIIKNNALTI